MFEIFQFALWYTHSRVHCTMYTHKHQHYSQCLYIGCMQLLHWKPCVADSPLHTYMYIQCIYVRWCIIARASNCPQNLLFQHCQVDWNYFFHGIELNEVIFTFDEIELNEMIFKGFLPSLPPSSIYASLNSITTRMLPTTQVNLWSLSNIFSTSYVSVPFLF